MKFGFPKLNRLKHKKDIQKLFSSKSFFCPPFKVYFLLSLEEETHKILITVPKRNFKKAVDRNKIKRRIRESFRQNHTSYLIKGLVAFVYIDNKINSYSQIEESIKKCLMKLSKVIKNK